MLPLGTKGYLCLLCFRVVLVIVLGRVCAIYRQLYITHIVRSAKKLILWRGLIETSMLSNEWLENINLLPYLNCTRSLVIWCKIWHELEI